MNQINSAVVMTLLEPESPQFITYDLEFIDDGETIDLVSLGMIAGDLRRLYVINRDFDQAKLLRNPWMRHNVWPSLPLDKSHMQEGSGRGLGRMFPKAMCMCPKQEDGGYECWHWNGKLDKDHPDVRPMGQIRRMVSDFIKAAHPNSVDIKNRDDVRMWAYYGAYDHVRLAQIFGPMVSLPDHVPMLTHDLKSEAMRLGNPKMPEQKGRLHNALDDAAGNLAKALFLRDLVNKMEGTIRVPSQK